MTKQGGLPRFALDIEGHPDLPGEAKLMSYRNIISEMRLRGHGALGTVYNSNSDLETYHQFLLVYDRSTIKLIDFQQEPGNQVVFGPNDAPSHFMMLPGRHIY